MVTLYKGGGCVIQALLPLSPLTSFDYIYEPLSAVVCSAMFYFVWRGRVAGGSVVKSDSRSLNCPVQALSSLEWRQGVLVLDERGVPMNGTPFSILSIHFCMCAWISEF